MCAIGNSREMAVRSLDLKRLPTFVLPYHEAQDRLGITKKEGNFTLLHVSVSGEGGIPIIVVAHHW